MALVLKTLCFFRVVGNRYLRTMGYRKSKLQNHRDSQRICNTQHTAYITCTSWISRARKAKKAHAVPPHFIGEDTEACPVTRWGTDLGHTLKSLHFQSWALSETQLLHNTVLYYKSFLPSLAIIKLQHFRIFYMLSQAKQNYTSGYRQINLLSLAHDRYSTICFF